MSPIPEMQNKTRGTITQHGTAQQDRLSWYAILATQKPSSSAVRSTNPMHTTDRNLAPRPGVFGKISITDKAKVSRMW